MAKKCYFCHCLQATSYLLKNNIKQTLSGSIAGQHKNKTASHLNNLNALTSRKKSSVVRLTRNSRIFKTIIHAIEEKKGEKIVSLDLRKIPEAVADFFIICQASNSTQLKAIADFVEKDLREKCGETAYKHEGRQAQQWILIDYVNIVVHVMMPEPRKFYQLEEMWSDAPMMEHR
jgi:ribosome-associated protein